MPRFNVVPSDSRVWIKARSSLHPIDSESSGIEGFVEAELGPDGNLDLSVPPKARIKMAVELLSSGNMFYDREMKRRVDARRFPTIDGELTAASRSGSDGRYIMTGEVTFRGVTNSYRDEMTLDHNGDGTICLEGEHTFDLRDFEFDPPRILMLRVYPEVTVKVRVVARAKD